MSHERLRGIAFHGTISKRIERKASPVARPVVFVSPEHPLEEGAGLSFLRWVLLRAGLQAAHYRAAPLLRRLPACLRALRVESLGAARELLAARPLLVPKALEALLIGTTEWFRDPDVFVQLEHEVLPEILRRTPAPRVWSAGCSEGSELYSVAMLLAKSGSLLHGHLLGSDCRTEAIDRARRGIYERPPLPPAFHRYLYPAPGGRISVSPEIRRAVHWELADILAPAAVGTWDLILCRNVTIYLEPAAAEELWLRLAEALAPGGFLVVGKAEKPRPACLRRTGHSIYRKCTPPRTTS